MLNRTLLICGINKEDGESRCGLHLRSVYAAIECPSRLSNLACA
jgi:hypothetical protein